MRLQDDKLLKQIVKWNPTGTRKRGRPNITWNEEVKINMDKRYINDKGWLHRYTWRRKVMGL
jgi:hypothetical protein